MLGGGTGHFKGIFIPSSARDGFCVGFKLLTYEYVAFDFEPTVLVLRQTTILGRGHAPQFRMVFAVFVRCPCGCRPTLQPSTLPSFTEGGQVLPGGRILTKRPVIPGDKVVPETGVFCWPHHHK